MADLGQLSDLLYSDTLKLVSIISFVSVSGALLKNYLEKKKLSKFKQENLSGNSTTPQEYLTQSNHDQDEDCLVETLDPKFELIAKLKTTDFSELKNLLISELEKIIKKDHKSIRISNRLIGSLGSTDTIFVGLLLADRKGSINLIDHIELYETMSSFANKNHLSLELEEYSKIVKKLKTLASNLQALDAKLSVRLSLKELPSKATMREFAAKLNLSSISKEGFVKRNENGQILFNIFPSTEEIGLNLVMDLPRVSNPSQAFNVMSDCGEWLAFNLDGKLTDDRGIQLTQEAKKMILSQIKKKQLALEKFGLVPGGNLAMRIFN